MRVVNYFGFQLAIRVVFLLLVTVGLGFIFRQQEWFFSQIVLGGLMVLLIAEVTRFVHQGNRRLTRFISGIRYGEFEGFTKEGSMDGAFVGLEAAMHGMSRELLLRKKKEDQDRQLLQTMVEVSHEGLLVFDQTGKVHCQNEFFTENLQLPSIIDLEQLRPLWGELFEITKSVSVTGNRAIIKAPDTREFLVEVQSRQLSGGQFSFLTLSENKSEESNAWLNLVKVINHEIGNGIAPIISLSESLLKKLERESELKLGYENGLQTIHSQALSLARFSDQYRTLIQVAPPVKTTFTWNNVLSHVKQTNETLVVDNLRLIIEGDALGEMVKADRKQMEQVLVNLITNARRALVKVENPQITITVNRAKLDYVLLVSDNGIGIPAEGRSALFVPFVSSSSQGSGIGLALSRKIIENHGGRIRLVANDQVGSTFRIQIPAI